MSEEQYGTLRLHRVSQSEWDEFATIAGLDHDGDGLDRCVRSAYLDLSRTLAGMATFADAEAWHRGTAGFLKMWLESDWCWTMHPWQVTNETQAMVERNIIVLLRNYLACSAYETIIFDWVLHNEFIVRTIFSGLQELECRLTRVSLVCTPEELRARLIADARPPSPLDEAVLRLPLYQALDAPCLDTTGLTVPQVADRVQEMISAGSNRS